MIKWYEIGAGIILGLFIVWILYGGYQWQIQRTVCVSDTALNLKSQGLRLMPGTFSGSDPIGLNKLSDFVSLAKSSNQTIIYDETASSVQFFIVLNGAVYYVEACHPA